MELPGSLSDSDNFAVCAFNVGYTIWLRLTWNHFHCGQWMRNSSILFNPCNGIQDQPVSNTCVFIYDPRAVTLFALIDLEQAKHMNNMKRSSCENLGFWVAFWNQTSAPLLLHVLLWCWRLHCWVHFWNQSSFCSWVFFWQIFVVEASMLVTSTITLHQE